MAKVHSWIPVSAAKMTERNWIQEGWDKLQGVPGGTRIYSKLLSRMVPYSGSIDPHVRELRRQYARVEIPDCRSNRNHLASVHAIALANLAELAANLALAYTIPADARFIVKGFTIDYLKKSRGTITAEGNCPDIRSSEKSEFDTIAILKDESGDVVAEATFRSLVGPKPA